jgi:hypothetical protein
MSLNAEATAKLYYTPPSDEHFNILKDKAIELWNEIGGHPNYTKEKVDRIKNLENIADNFMFIVAGFDFYNQNILATKLSEEIRKEIRERMISGGNDPLYIPF